jgi:DNA invertase Pin-like site-specific DNA recombinase
VLYGRVSTREQHEEGFSIAAQLKACRAYAAAKGLHIVREFVDVESAKRTGRPEFDAMVAFLSQEHGVGAVVVEKTDRLYRNLHDWVTVDRLGVELHLVKEATVVSEESPPPAKFYHGVMVLMAKQYVDLLGAEASKGLLEKAEQGHWPSVAPIGYVNNRESRRIEVDPHRAPLVKQVSSGMPPERCRCKNLLSGRELPV